MDAAPLQVVRNQDTNVRHFAEGFHVRIQNMLGTRPAPAAGQVIDSTWDNAEPVRIVGPGTERFITAEEIASQLLSTVLVLLDDAVLPGQVVYQQDVYGHGAVRCCENATLRAVYAGHSLTLAADSVVARWAHSNTRLIAEAGCRLLGRATANERIVVGEDVEFERLNAPLIRSGHALSVLAIERVAGHAWEPPRAERIGGVSWLVMGDCAIPAGAQLNGSLVVRGKLHIGAGARVEGGIKAHREIELEAGVVVRGAVVSGTSIVANAACRIRGPVIAQAGIDIMAGCIIGTPGKPTSVTAADIVIDSGVQLSGTVWAHRSGRTARAGARES